MSRCENSPPEMFGQRNHSVCGLNFHSFSLLLLTPVAVKRCLAHWKHTRHQWQPLRSCFCASWWSVLVGCSHSNVTFPLYHLYLTDLYLLVSSVWTVQARHLNVKTDDQEEDQVDLSVEAGRVCDYSVYECYFQM